MYIYIYVYICMCVDGLHIDNVHQCSNHDDRAPIPADVLYIYSAYIIAAETGHAELLCRNHRTSVHRIEVEIVRNVEEHDVELPYALASMAFVQQHHQLFAVEQHGEKPGMRHGSVVQGTAGQACQGQPQHFFRAEFTLLESTRAKQTNKNNRTA